MLLILSMSERFADHKEFLGFSGKVVILGGPNGSGKDTQEAMLTERLENSRRILRHITRQPASGEVEGVDYYFINEKRLVRCAQKVILSKAPNTQV